MALAYEIPLPSPSCHHIDSLKGVVNHIAYERFYRALCSHWAVLIKLWLARFSRYRTSSIRNRVFATVWMYWLDHPARNFREKVETIEVVEYAWDFLGRKIFWNPDQVPDWLHGENALREYDGRFAAGSWLFFVRSVAEYIHPPHIIELLNDMWNPRSRPLEKGKYLHGLGSFDTLSLEGFPEIDEGVGSHDTFYPTNYVEADGMDRLVGGDAGGFYESQWMKYRYTQWVNDLRGQVLFSTESSEQLLRRIRSC